MKNEVSSNTITDMVDDLSSEGELHLGNSLSIHRKTKKGNTSYHASVFLSPKPFGTVRKNPIAVFTVETHTYDKPSITRYRPGHWVQELVLIHSQKMRIQEQTRCKHQEERLRKHQEFLAEELSAFLPIDDDFILEISEGQS